MAANGIGGAGAQRRKSGVWRNEALAVTMTRRRKPARRDIIGVIDCLMASASRQTVTALSVTGGMLSRRRLKLWRVANNGAGAGGIACYTAMMW